MSTLFERLHALPPGGTALPAVAPRRDPATLSPGSAELPVALAVPPLSTAAGQPARPLLAFLLLPVLAAILGLGLVREDPRLLLAVGAPFALALCVLRFEAGILLLLVTAAAVPFALSTGSQSPIVASLVLSALLMVLWLVRALLRRAPELAALRPPPFAHLTQDSALRTQHSPLVPTTWPLLAFLGANLLALPWSTAFMDVWVAPPPGYLRVQMGALGVMVLSGGVYLLVAQVPSSDRLLRWLVGIYLALAALALLANLGQVHLPLPINTRGLFATWAVAFALALAIAPAPKGALTGPRALAVRGFLLLVGLGWLYLVAEPGLAWLSGWVPALAAAGVVALLRSRRLFLVLLLLILAVAAARGDYYYQRVVLAQMDEGSVGGDSGRDAIWARSLEMAEQHPLFGTGPAGYAVYYMTYFPDRAWSTHSNYLDVLAQSGLVGTTCFLLFLGTLARALWRIRRRVEPGFPRAYLDAALGGFAGVLVAMAFGDWFIPFVYNQSIAGFSYTVYSWIFLGGALALGRLATAGSEPARSAHPHHPLAGGLR